MKNLNTYELLYLLTWALIGGTYSVAWIMPSWITLTIFILTFGPNFIFFWKISRPTERPGQKWS